MIITSDIPVLRDPFILIENGVYYAYGTGWLCYKSRSLDGHWECLGKVVTDPPSDDGRMHWAPEVHRYNGAYYMFTTYFSTEIHHRGCTVMRADSPEGPFTEISNGVITPREWDSIDGTLYIDPQGQPWMVFVHEWTCTPDGIGTMAIAKLSEDLTHLISEPIEVFRADDAPWSRTQITDGCWMHTTKDGQLLMLWSCGDDHGYCVGIARSKNGRIDGEWTHDELPLFSKAYSKDYDGGHGMIFTDADGATYLSIHSPNDAGAGRRETPIFVPVREENGTLVCEFD